MDDNAARTDQASPPGPETSSVEQQLLRHGVKLGPGGIAPRVFWPALVIVAVVAVFSAVFTDTAGTLWNSVQSGIVTNFGWFYTLVIAGFVVFALFLAFSRFGDITLGRDGEEAEFGLMSWFAMLFAAGMGIGLVFYGVAEPLTFFTSPPPGVPADASNAELAERAMAQTFMHWGFHPWSVYAIIGLALAYAIHRKGRPVSIRWALEPLFGDRVKGTLGDVVDILAIVGTVFGVATSLGLGVTQVATGLSELGIVEESTDTLLVVLIVAITAIAVVSVVSGVGKGIRYLSNANLVLAGVFLLAVLLLGPTLFLARDFVQSLGAYAASIVPITFEGFAFSGEEGISWASGWTIFYWGWWISWAPFVGVFIARISRGRTVREFVTGTLLVPTLASFVWFTVMGGTAIMRQIEVGDLVGEDGVTAEVALFDTLNTLPLGTLLSGIAIILVVIFFVTSSDSGSLVVDMLASGGHPDPPTWSRVLWACLEGLVAIGLLLAGGSAGLSALQAGSVATGFPFAVVMVLISISLYKALATEHHKITRAELRMRSRELAGELHENFDDVFGPKVDDRIDYALAQNHTLTRRDRRRKKVSAADGDGG